MDSDAPFSSSHKRRAGRSQRRLRAEGAGCSVEGSGCRVLGVFCYLWASGILEFRLLGLEWLKGLRRMASAQRVWDLGLGFRV